MSSSLSVQEHFAVVFTLAMPLQPQERHEYFEDEIDYFLEDQPIAEYCGGGTLLNPDDSISAADIELAFQHTNDIPRIIDFLEKLGAAKGSIARYQDQGGNTIEIGFGTQEGIALWLDNQILNNDNHCTQGDIETLYAAISQSMKPVAPIALSGQEVGDNYVIYFYGPSFNEMERALQALFGHFTALKNAYLQRIA